MSTFDDLNVGDTFATPSVTVSEDTAATLVKLGGYTHPLFTDPGFAASSPFGRAPLPGQAILLIMGGLVEQSERFDETTIALLGFDEVAFRKPAFAGGGLAVDVTVLEKEPRGVLIMRWACRDGDGDVVCDARARMLFRVG
jgi:acyl dehydratase